MPLLAAKPAKVKMKEAKMMAGDNVDAIVIRVLQFNVPMPIECSVRAKTRISPIKEKSMHVEVMKMYFRAAPIFFGAFNMTIRIAEKAVVNSARIQNKAKLFAKNVKVMFTSNNSNAT
jgi:hypothetical protein